MEKFYTSFTVMEDGTPTACGIVGIDASERIQAWTRYNRGVGKAIQEELGPDYCEEGVTISNGTDIYNNPDLVPLPELPKIGLLVF